MKEHESFEVPRAKVENAKDHRLRAEQLFDVYRHAHPLKIEKRPAPPGMIAFSFVPSAPLDKKVPMAVGDAVHNLRAALDYLARVVVELSGKDAQKVGFPFAGSVETLPKNVKERYFHRASQEAKQLLLDLKPYEGGNALLWALHSLDLGNKHRTIVATAESAIVPEMRVGSMTLTDTEVGQNRGADFVMRPQMVQVPYPVLANLHFQDVPNLLDTAVIPTLVAFEQMVTDIIDRFSKLFVIKE